MFKRSNFCHVASNNRNNVKAGLFVYRTTDDLATVTTSGYFNEMIIDVDLHDIIIHEQVNASDSSKVEYNLLCITEKTLDNIKTAFIKSAFEKEIEQILNEGFVKLDGSSVMTGPLKFSAGSMRGAIAGGLNGVTFFKMDTQGNLTQIGYLSDSQFVPARDNTLDIGTNVRKIERIYLDKVNNGYDIDVPVTNSADTLALKSQVDDAANSGEQLYTTGVWYAKMYSASTVPTGSEYEGRNYADFSQVDGNNDPIIVVYTYTSGAWALTETITPPKNHNGYMTITSKIWDIAEQSGQQGGLVLWSHNQGTFTPYPRIVSFESINVTGESTVSMPANPVNSQIANKQYVDDSIASIPQAVTSIDADIAGSLTVASNGDVSGFGYSNYLLYPGSLYMADANSFEMVFVFTTGTGSTGGIVTIEHVVSHGFYLYIYNNKILCDIGSSNILAGTTTLADNTKYYVKLVYDGTNYTQYVSTDGSTWNTDATTTATDLPGAISEPYMLGHGTSGGNTGFQTLHMNECYIKKDSIVVWQGVDCPGLHQRAKGRHEVIEFQAPTANNNYTWYRKYADGWVEMGGEFTQTANSAIEPTITFPVELADTHYMIVWSAGAANTTAGTYFAHQVVESSKATTGCQVKTGNNNTTFTVLNWQVSYMAA